MKNLLIFAAAVTVSTSVLAGNMSDSKDMKAMHSQMMDKSSIEEILKNEEMQRLHRDMTRNAMSEGGFEARVQMMTEEGRAYHKALKQRQKIPQGNPCGKVNSWRRKRRLARASSSRRPDHAQVNHRKLKLN